MVIVMSLLKMAITNADGDYTLYKGEHSLAVQTGVGGLTPTTLTVTYDAGNKWTNLHSVA